MYNILLVAAFTNYGFNIICRKSVQPYVDDEDFYMIKETVRNVNELE